jgi:hypothetical protein
MLGSDRGGVELGEARVVGEDDDVGACDEPRDIRCSGDGLEHALVSVDAGP